MDLLIENQPKGDTNEQIGESLEETSECNPAKKMKTEDSKLGEKVLTKNPQPEQVICKHTCEKKRRRCKFSAMRGSEFCVEHAAYNKQVNRHF
jgi:hypothetical protein